MANAVLYNQGSHPAGALKSGTMSLNVSPSLEVGALKWRNGFENNNTWVIYSDTYSQGQATQGNALPTIWASTDFTDSGLVNLINVLPARAGQTPFTNVTAATSWLRGQGVYFLSNQNYPQIVTSGMTLIMDAGFPASFPTGTGTTWYDISGNDYVGSMVNTPSWTNSGTKSYINFDGSDDYVLVSNNADILSKTSYTKIAWFNASTFSTNNNIISGGNSGQHAFWLAGGNKLNAGHNSLWSTVQSTSTLSLNTWYYGAVTFDTTNGWKLYLNGVQESTSNSTTTFNGNGEILIGAFANASNLFTGKIANSMVYNRVLSQSEILQNYYKGPIVTSGLTMDLDASNIVSYDTSGITWKNLVTDNLYGTLTNDPTYDSDGGGSIVFDGANDRVSLSNSPIPDNFTYSIWVKRNGDGNQGNRGIVISNGSTYIDVGFSNRILFSLILSGGSQNLIQSANGTMVSTGVWAHYTATYNRQKAVLYLNGVEVASSNYTLPPINDFSTFVIGQYAGGSYNLNGKIGNVLYYNRALSAAEVQQNYNAQRGRFGI
jgi:hypothetical protein